MNTPDLALDLSWDDLRLLRAVLTTGSLSQAALLLHVTQPTVGRRLSALEEQLGAPLVERSTLGCTPTEAARLLLPHIEQMHAAAEGVSRARQLVHGDLRGLVRVACGELVARFLARRLASLLNAAPHLHLDLLASTLPVNLARGDAELALRSQPPPGDAWIVRDLGPRTYAPFASPAYIEAHPFARDPLLRLQLARWITFTPDLSDVPSGRWLRDHLHPDAPTLRFDRSTLILEAAAAGCGIALLPTHIGDDEPRLVQLPHPPEDLIIQGHLVCSSSAWRLPRVKHVARWLAQMLGGT